MVASPLPRRIVEADIIQTLVKAGVVVVAVGLFAVGETLYLATYLNRTVDKLEQVKGSIWMTASDWARSWKPWLRGTLLGFPIGAMPAGGAEIPTFLSYAIEKKLSKHPEEFGHGAIEGVAGPEAANNASSTGTLSMLRSRSSIGRLSHSVFSIALLRLVT